MPAITVARLVAECAANGVSPRDAVLFIEREIPAVATAADPTVTVGPDGHVFGFLIDAPDTDEDEDSDDDW